MASPQVATPIRIGGQGEALPLPSIALASEGWLVAVGGNWGLPGLVGIPFGLRGNGLLADGPVAAGGAEPGAAPGARLFGIVRGFEGVEPGEVDGLVLLAGLAGWGGGLGARAATGTGRESPEAATRTCPVTQIGVWSFEPE